MTDPIIVTTTPEQRQISRARHFPPDLAQYIDWREVADTARQLGCHWDVRRNDDFSITVTWFWTYTEREDVTTTVPITVGPDASEAYDAPFGAAVHYIEARAVADAQDVANRTGSPVGIWARDRCYTVCDVAPELIEPDPALSGWTLHAVVDPHESEA